MKVIFMDIDGVLNSNYWNDIHQTEISNGEYIDEKKVQLFAKIIEKTGAVIVMHSGRRFWFDDKLKNENKILDEEADLRNSFEKQNWKINVRKNFYTLINQENKETLLELGAGSGYNSQFFMKNGLKVIATDLSSEMIKKCKEKNIEAYELDFYNSSDINKKFDCICAMNTLLHVPKADSVHPALLFPSETSA